MSAKIVAIVQARMDSTRFPKKVMQKICGIPLIELLLLRLSKSKMIDEIIVATTKKESDNDLVKYIQELKFTVYRGSENDVLDRYYQAAKLHKAGIVIRITGDCPLVDPQLVDDVIGLYHAKKADYVGTGDPPTFPDGLDTEVFSYKALETAYGQAKEKFDREHVTPFIRRNEQFKRENFSNVEDLSNERWTVDEPEDFEVISAIINHFSPNFNFTWKDVNKLKNSHPEYFEANKTITRNEGAIMGKGQKLWKRAKKIIPGGNMLLSKRAEMFLPNLWPAYFNRAKGCKVWDLDGNEYTDMSIMGIGTNTLGYGQSEVDEAVRKVVDQGNMSTFNCPEEIYLAERLVELHPWADMVRFARTGGEANAISIRIARAASGRDKVAICGYHGWHDWYLSANLGDDSTLDGHLLPGLEPKGVPRSLKGTVLPFRYNHFEELEALIKQYPDIGVIKTEVQRNEKPKDGFLEKVRDLATSNNIVLVFDECTSGFRETYGGLHKKYGVEPDMAVFGKALGNGYAITSVIGRRDVMEAAQSTFISSTFWTERIGPTAGLKTLEIMEREKSWEQITKTGKFIQKSWIELAIKNGLDIEVGGLPAIPYFSFNSPRSLEYKTFITQEMLKKGYLASNIIFSCTVYNTEIIDKYINELDTIFCLIKECEEGRNIMDLLDGPVCHSGFKRLT